MKLQASRYIDKTLVGKVQKKSQFKFYKVMAIPWQKAARSSRNTFPKSSVYVLTTKM
jgi:hypothetical protein